MESSESSNPKVSNSVKNTKREKRLEQKKNYYQRNRNRLLEEKKEERNQEQNLEKLKLLREGLPDCIKTLIIQLTELNEKDVDYEKQLSFLMEVGNTLIFEHELFNNPNTEEAVENMIKCLKTSLEYHSKA